MEFKVLDILDSNTIHVDGWNWGEEFSGTKVKINELLLNVIDVNFTKSKLEILLNNKNIELVSPTNIDKGKNKSGDDIIYCSVQLNGINIEVYFPELKHKEDSKKSNWLSSII
jgi:hypothetical protein